MKRRIRTTFLALLLTATVTLSAQAALLFPPTADYRDQFKDVLTTDWFYSNVATLYDLGLTNGKGDSAHFAPQDEMTIAEVITMAARLRSLYDFGQSEAGAAFFRANTTQWYESYIAYLKYSNVIGPEFDARLDLPATRAEVARILVRTLPGELFLSINKDAVNVGYALGRYIQDVNDYTPYQQDILTLYRWGILSGMDSVGSFCPAASVRRCEVAAMVTRLVDSDLRITLDWDIEERPIVSSLSQLVQSDGRFYPAPAPEDSAAIDADIRYMLSRGERTLTLNYGTPQPKERIAAIMNAFLAAVRQYPEQTYNQIHVSYNQNSGKISIRFSCSLYSDDMLEFYRGKILSAAVQIREKLYTDGLLHTEMPQYEKARVYFDWLCNSCEYHFDCSKTDLSHSAYGAFYSHLAVCDGYTAAYNLLLKLEGIECSAVDLEEWDHMWTVAVLDGTNYHIDVTWGDQTGTIAGYYFGMTEEQSYARFH